MVVNKIPNKRESDFAKWVVNFAPKSNPQNAATQPKQPAPYAHVWQGDRNKTQKTILVTQMAGCSHEASGWQ